MSQDSGQPPKPEVVWGIRTGTAQEERPTLPTYTQWNAWKLTLPPEGKGLCILCRRGVPFFARNGIVLSSRVKQWTEEIEQYVAGGVLYTDTKLVAKVIPVFVKGSGCPDCQDLMRKAVSAELHRREVSAGIKRALRVQEKFRPVDARGISLPWAVSQGKMIVRMREVTLSVSERTPAIDVTEAVLDMPRGTQVREEEV